MSQRGLQDPLFFCILPKDSQIHMKFAFAALVLGLSVTPAAAHPVNYRVTESINLTTTRNCHMHPKRMVFHCHKHEADHHKNDRNSVYYNHRHVKHTHTHAHHHHPVSVIKVKIK